MRRPVVGVIGSAYRIEDRFATQLVGERNLRAVAEVAGALPLMFAAAPDITDIGALLDAVDGIVLTGARANVHPARFGSEPDSRHEPFDLHRDDLALALSEACVARGIPLFGICRGLQEMNVAFGGSLHPEIRGLPTRRALRSACNGMPNTTRSAIPSTEHCFGRSARRCWRTAGQTSWRDGAPRFGATALPVMRSAECIRNGVKSAQAAFIFST